MQIPSGGVFFFDSGIGGLNVLSACRKVLLNIPFYTSAIISTLRTATNRLWK